MEGSHNFVSGIIGLGKPFPHLQTGVATGKRAATGIKDANAMHYGPMSSPALAKALQFHFCSVQLQSCHKELTAFALSMKSESRPRLRNKAIRSCPGLPKCEQTAGTRARAAYFLRLTPSITETAEPARVCLGSPRARAKGLTTAKSIRRVSPHQFWKARSGRRASSATAVFCSIGAGYPVRSSMRRESKSRRLLCRAMR